MPKSIYKDLGVEFGKFNTKPYIEAMKSEIEISYPKDIVDIVKARKAYVRVQAGSSNAQAEPRNVTLDPALRPSSVLASEVGPNSLALGK